MGLQTTVFILRTGPKFFQLSSGIPQPLLTRPSLSLYPLRSMQYQYVACCFKLNVFLTIFSSFLCTFQKLPFTIPDLVRASPCRSSDGILYTGLWVLVMRIFHFQHGKIVAIIQLPLSSVSIIFI